MTITEREFDREVTLRLLVRLFSLQNSILSGPLSVEGRVRRELGECLAARPSLSGEMGDSVSGIGFSWG